MLFFKCKFFEIFDICHVWRYPYNIFTPDIFIAFQKNAFPNSCPIQPGYRRSIRHLTSHTDGGPAAFCHDVNGQQAGCPHQVLDLILLLSLLDVAYSIEFLDINFKICS